MSQAIKISIIVPIFNEEATLANSLKALCSEISSSSECELICIDNGSTDRSVEIAQTFPEVTLLHEKRQGAYAARNHGAAVARGRILMFTDPDCIVSKGWLVAATTALSEDGCLLALGLRRPAPDRGLNRLLGDYEEAKDRWVLSSNEPLKYYGFTNNMAVSRIAWEQSGPFDDRLRGSDTIFVRRLVDSAGCQAVEFVPKMGVSHLEIDGPSTYLKKSYTYGKSLQSYRRAVAVKPLNFSDRYRIFMSAIRHPEYNIFRSSALALLLVAGVVSWSFGRFVGILSRLLNH